MTTPTNDPPSYDEVPKRQQQQPEAFNDVKVIPQPEIQPAPAYTMPGPSNYLIQPVNNGQTPIVYRYINHSTGEQVASLLPPTHPEMICLQSGHVPHTNYGILGILAAVFWFPLGVGLCLLDRHVKCTRCGGVLDEGLCR